MISSSGEALDRKGSTTAASSEARDRKGTLCNAAGAVLNGSSMASCSNREGSRRVLDSP
jgi:hypothetical protein